MGKEIIDFPEEKGRYWYLHWIDKIFYENKSFKVEFCFVNLNGSNALLPQLNIDKTHGIRVSVQYLLDYRVGTIYDPVDQKKIINPQGFENINFSVSEGKITKPTKGIFPLVNYKYFPLVKDLDSSELTFFKFRAIKYKTYSVIVTPYCLLEYFVFRSSSLIRKLFNGEILSAFQFDKMKILKSNEDGLTIAELPFDKSKLSENDAKIIASLLFLKNNAGIKMINNVYSSIHKSFSENIGRKKEISGVLDVSFDLGGYEMELTGKSHYSRGVDEHKIFFASKINKIEFTENPYTVDAVTLIPINGKSRNYDPSDDPPSGIPINSKALNLYLNESANRTSKKNQPEKIQTDQKFQTGIDISIEPVVLDESYYENFSPFEEAADGKGRGDEEVVDMLKEITILQQEIEKIYSSILYISNLKYFARVIDFLSNFEDLAINYDPLNIEENNYPIYKISKSNKSFIIDVVEIIKDNDYYVYLVEFGSGNIGVFRNVIPTKKIESQLILELIEIFVNVNPEDHGHKILWTAIHRKLQIFALGKGVKLELGIEHTRASEGVPTEVTANRIYNERILKIR